MTPPEIQLWESFEASRSDDDRNALCVHYLAWLEGVARRVYAKLPQYQGLEVEDGVNDAAPALLDCIQRFDRSRGNEFTTFASLRVAGAMRDGLRLRDWVPRLVRHQAKIHPVVIPQILALDRRNLKPMEDDHAERRVIQIRAPEESKPTDTEDFWRDVLACCNKSERLAILMYFRLGCTMREIGQSLGLSESSISQSISKAREKMRASKRATDAAADQRRVA